MKTIELNEMSRLNAGNCVVSAAAGLGASLGGIVAVLSVSTGGVGFVIAVAGVTLWAAADCYREL